MAYVIGIILKWLVKVYKLYSNIIDARINSRGQDYYWLAGELDYGAESVPTDVEYARKGYITGVALTWKQQCDIGMEAVKNILDKI